MEAMTSMRERISNLETKANEVQVVKQQLDSLKQYIQVLQDRVNKHEQALIRIVGLAAEDLGTVKK